MKNLKINKVKLTSLILGGSFLVLAGSKSLNNNEINTFEIGEHNIVETIDEVYYAPVRSFRKYIKSSKGYEVIDYDFSRDNFHNIENILYKNTTKVETPNINNLESFEESSLEEKEIFHKGEHKIVDVNVDFSLTKKSTIIRNIQVPSGYKVLKYNYDKNNEYSYEITLYENTVDVQIEDINDFGKLLDNKNKPPLCVIAVTKANTSIIYKDKSRNLKCPEDFEIIDFDYNRTINREIETIVYSSKYPINKEEILDKFLTEENNYFVEVVKKQRNKIKKYIYEKNLIDYNLISFSGDYNKYYEYDSKLYEKK